MCFFPSIFVFLIILCLFVNFLSQKKVSSFQNLAPATSETHDLSKSYIPNVRTAGPSNYTCQLATLAPTNFVKASNGEASGETNVVSCFSSGISVQPVSHYRAKSISEAANIHLGKVNVVGASTMNNDLSAHGLEKPDRLSLSNPVLQNFGDVSRIHDEINVQLAECKPRHLSFNNFGESTKSHLGEKNGLGSQGLPRALSNGSQDFNEPSSEQVEFPNSPKCILERISSDSQRSGIGSCNSLKRSRSSIDLEHGGSFEENIGNGSCAFEKDVNEGQDETLGTRRMRILRTKEVESSGIDHCISNECKNTIQSTSAWSNSDSMHIDDEKPTIPMSNSKSLQREGSSLTSHHDFDSHENEILAGVSNGVGENNLKSEIDLCLIQHSTADACLDIGPVVRNCNDHTDEMADISSNIEQNNTDLEMKRNLDDYGDVAIARNTDAAETLPLNPDLCTSDTENQLYEAQIQIGSEQVPNEDPQNSHVQSSVNDFNQLPGLQNRCTDLVDVSQNNHQGKCSNDDLHTSNSEEYKDEIITNGVIDYTNQVASHNNLEFQEISASARSSKHSTANSSEHTETCSTCDDNAQSMQQL